MASKQVPPGTPAPEFTLPSTLGGEIGLAAYRGHKHVVLVFLRSRR